MKDSTQIGRNRTGVQMSPILTKEMLDHEGIRGSESVSTISINDMRKAYAQESGQLGTVPLPGTMKGAVSTGLEKLKGSNPEMLIDKLSERMAFERSGVRIYDALITKCEALMPNVSTELLRQFKEEEADHFQILWEATEAIGADPTSQTPCADAVGVQSMGILQVVTDPRTSIPQCVNALLTAELTDNDGWDLLIALAKDAGLTEIVQRFEIAKAQEDKHLVHIRSWLHNLVMKNEAVSIQ